MEEALFAKACIGISEYWVIGNQQQPDSFWNGHSNTIKDNFQVVLHSPNQFKVEGHKLEAQHI